MKEIKEDVQGASWDWQWGQWTNLWFATFQLHDRNIMLGDAMQYVNTLSRPRPNHFNTTYWSRVLGRFQCKPIQQTNCKLKCDVTWKCIGLVLYF